MRRANYLIIFIGRLSTNSGSLNALEPKGPDQACNGLVIYYICINVRGAFDRTTESTLQLHCALCNFSHYLEYKSIFEAERANVSQYRGADKSLARPTS